VQNNCYLKAHFTSAENLNGTLSSWEQVEVNANQIPVLDTLFGQLIFQLDPEQYAIDNLGLENNFIEAAQLAEDTFGAELKDGGYTNFPKVGQLCYRLTEWLFECWFV
jgi:hypothetical protein